MLKIENLDVFYGDAQALDGVSLEIEEGAIVAIVGANGAGKTSLIRTIAGMIQPSRGRIVYRGADIAGWPSHKVCDLGIGQVAEGRQVFPTLSVAENLAMGAMLPRAHPARSRNRDRVMGTPASFMATRASAVSQTGETQDCSTRLSSSSMQKLAKASSPLTTAGWSLAYPRQCSARIALSMAG